jgi:hypothetical protein
MDYEYGDVIDVSKYVPTPGLDEADYKPELEALAPGICAMVDSVRIVREAWYVTLQRMMPFVNATSEQKIGLIALAKRAASGLPPVGYVAPEPQSGPAMRLTGAQIMTAISALTLLGGGMS